MNITLSKHARWRIKQRFNIGNQDPQQWATEKLTNAIYVGVGVDENGNESRIFSAKGVTLFLSLNADKVITVIPPKNSNSNRYKDAVLNVVMNEFAKFNESVTQNIRSIQAFVSELKEEIDCLNDMLKRTRSIPKKLAIRGRIKAVEERINELPDEEHELKRELTRYASGLAAYL